MRDTYRDRAEECRTKADGVDDPEVKHAFLDAAAKWEMLARQPNPMSLIVDRDVPSDAFVVRPNDQRDGSSTAK
jgi:hypothetical protein